MAKRAPINHDANGITEATGINVEGLTEKINNSVRQFNQEQPNPSQIVEHLEDNFNKRELAIIVMNDMMQERQAQHPLAGLFAALGAE